MNFYLEKDSKNSHIWQTIISYLIYTDFSIQQVLEKENYMKNHKKDIFVFFNNFFLEKQNDMEDDFFGPNPFRFLKKDFSKERFFKVLLFSGIEKKFSLKTGNEPSSNRRFTRYYWLL